MDKKILSLFIVLCAGLFLLSACNVDNSDSLESGDTEVEGIDVDVNAEGDTTVTVDTDSDLEADAQVTIDSDNEIVEVEIDMDIDVEVSEEELEAFCEAGSTYSYSSSDGSVDSVIIGLTTYQGSEFCQAQASSVIETAAGDISTETTYYFDPSYSEYWIETSVSSDLMPSAQVTTVHLIDGEVQS